jgi:hypothetical protein
MPIPSHTVDLILQFMHDGHALRQSCKLVGVAPSSFLDQMAVDSRDGGNLSERYAKARQACYDVKAEELEQLCSAPPPPEAYDRDGKLQSSWVNLRRLHVDTLKWTLSKVAPAKYGERVTVHNTDEKPPALNLIVEAKPEGVE